MGDGIEKLAQAAATEFEALKAQTGSARAADDFLYRAGPKKDGAIATFQIALKADVELAPIVNGWTQNRFGGHIIQPHMLEYGLYNAILGGHSADKLIKDAKQFAREKVCDVLTYTALCGIKIDRPVELSTGLVLARPEDVPEYPQKATFLGANELFMRPTATAFLIFTEEKQQVIFANSGEKEIGTAERLDDAAVVQILNCFTALTCKPATALGTWDGFSNSTMQLLQLGVRYRFTRNYQDMEMLASSASPGEITSDAIKVAFDQWNQLGSKHQSALEIGVDRLNQSIRQTTQVNKALDLGIALEVLLLHGIDVKTELNYRFNVHGANFIGGTHQQRLDNQKVLKDMYSLRSAAAHTGALGKEKTEKVTDTIRKSQEFASKIAQKVLQRGGFPDWNTEIVIGAD